MKLLLGFCDKHPFGFGLIGIGSGLSASAISFLQQLDLVIRVAGGTVALLVGLCVLTIQLPKAIFRVRRGFAAARRWFKGI